MIHPIEDIRAAWEAGVPVQKICKQYHIDWSTLQKIKDRNLFSDRDHCTTGIGVKTQSHLMAPIQPGEFDDDEHYNPDRCLNLLAEIINARFVDCFKPRSRTQKVCPTTARHFFWSDDFDQFAQFFDFDPDLFREKLSVLIKRHREGEDVLSEVRLDLLGGRR